jgi:membrane fusion protein (multidrug efflux system)
MKSKAIAGFIILGLVAAVAAAKLGIRSPGESLLGTEDIEKLVLVETAPVVGGLMTESTQAVGTLQSIASIVVRPEIPGVVRRIGFGDGQLVERGTSLVELDQEELQAQEHQAIAQEHLAQVTYDRLKRLVGQQGTIVPVQQVDEARLALQAASANRVLYATRLKKAIIRAPFAGTVGLRRISVGDYVQPGQDLVNLEDLQTLHVDFKVPEVWLSRVTIGQALSVSTDAFPDAAFDAQVSAVDPRVDPVNRTIAVRAAVPNPSGILRPGLFATVRLTLVEEPHALMIPEEAVFLQRDKSMVFRTEGETVRLTEVVLGVRERGMVSIRAGLKEGDQVVRTGTHKLRDGMRVSVK